MSMYNAYTHAMFNLQQAINCGFQSWIDKEWPNTLNNALSKLWSMYDDCSSTMMFERVERRSRELQEQKHIEALKNEVEVLKNAKEELKNVLKSQADVFRVKQKKVEAERDALLEEKKWEAERAVLLEEKKKWEAERAVLLEDKKKWEAERAVLKEEKKKLEYTIYEMFQANHENKVKLKKIKAICDE